MQLKTVVQYENKLLFTVQFPFFKKSFCFGLKFDACEWNMESLKQLILLTLLCVCVSSDSL